MDKETIKDIASRILYGVKVKCDGEVKTVDTVYSDKGLGFVGSSAFYGYNSFDIKPCLRRLTVNDMDDDELEFFEMTFPHINTTEKVDWLDAHMFDHRHLINKNKAYAVNRSFYYE